MELATAARVVAQVEIVELQYLLHQEVVEQVDTAHVIVLQNNVTKLSVSQQFTLLSHEESYSV